MGPRSIDRGKQHASRHTPAVTMLQWGRDRSIAESRRLPIGRMHDRPASMGPRSIDPRKAALSCDAVLNRRLASMGPRSIDRGKRTSRARRRQDHELQWGRDRSIAESVTGASAHATSGMLQWGRDRSIAESYVGCVLSSWWIDLASMGPRSFDRGKCSRNAGRDRGNDSFNGAAIDRSRKVSSARTKHHSKSLQWGRGSIDRGKAAIPSRTICSGRASMGPRSIDRGNEADYRERHGYLQLQWGRDRSIAERLVAVQVRTAPLSRLQWGRGSSIAERRIGGDGNDALSIGFNGAAIDRSRKGDGSEALRLAVTLLQWGRDLIDRGKERSAGNGDQCCEASMGPRSCDRGKIAATGIGRCMSDRFNGAAIDRSRKAVLRRWSSES